jgi:hypothetical protein
MEAVSDWEKPLGNWGSETRRIVVFATQKSYMG